jgi:DNA-binding transcriptional LysR family regulator
LFAIESIESRPEGITCADNKKRLLDLFRSKGFDLAIRLGTLPDSGLVARKLEDAVLCLVASPEYLRRNGTPRNLEDLASHACVSFVMPSSGRTAPWVFRVDGDDVDWPPPTRLEVTDDVLGVVSLAEHGIGICQSNASNEAALSKCCPDCEAGPARSR